MLKDKFMCRAAEARADADDLSDPLIRRELELIAAHYEKVADMIERFRLSDPDDYPLLAAAEELKVGVSMRSEPERK